MLARARHLELLLLRCALVHGLLLEAADDKTVDYFDLPEVRRERYVQFMETYCAKCKYASALLYILMVVPSAGASTMSANRLDTSTPCSYQGSIRFLQ